MDKLESHNSKEAAWRSRLLRHAQSGKSIAAFCRDESVSTASYHIWRAKRAASDGHGATPAQPAAFIDLGAIKDTGGVTSMANLSASAPPPAPVGVLDGCRADVSFIAGMIIDKFAYHQPLYRQHVKLQDSGINVSRAWSRS